MYLFIFSQGRDTTRAHIRMQFTARVVALKRLRRRRRGRRSLHHSSSSHSFAKIRSTAFTTTSLDRRRRRRRSLPSGSVSRPRADTRRRSYVSDDTASRRMHQAKATTRAIIVSNEMREDSIPARGGEYVCVCVCTYVREPRAPDGINCFLRLVI